MRRGLQGLLTHRLGGIGILVLVVGVVVSLFAPQVAPHDPYRQDLARRLQFPGSRVAAETPNYLGTDQLGRDILSRIVYGTRVSLGVAFLSVAGASFIGVILGVGAGYYGPPLDDAVMRIVDLQMAFPFILLALAILGALGPSLPNMIVVFIVTGWPIYSRMVRASVLSVKEKSLVESARALGARDARILAQHILPNSIGPIIVIGSFEVGRVILLESSLSFLGFGVQPPTPTWGTMVADGREYIRTAWWLITFPGLAMVAAVLAANLLGEAAREHLDPRQRTE
jgi:peptide/nickel transport system permease protein